MAGQQTPATPPTGPRVRRGRGTKAALWLLAGVAVYALAGFLGVPYLIESQAVPRLSAKLNRAVAVERVRFNPFTLRVTVEGLSLSERDGPDTFVSVARLSADLEASSLVKGGAVVREITVEAPAVKVTRNRDLSYNFSDLLPAGKPEAASASEPARFSLNNIRVTGGSLEFEDLPRGTRHLVREIGLGIPFLSNLPARVHIFVQPELRADVDGTRVALGGRTKPFTDSLETAFEVEVVGVDIPRYLAYLPAPPAFSMPSGLLDVKLSISFLRRSGGSPELGVSGEVKLRDLQVDDAERKPLLRLPMARVEIAELDPLSRRVAIGAVETEGGDLVVSRGLDGAWNLAALAPPPGADETVAEPSVEAEPPRPWRLSLGSLLVKDWTVRFEDWVPESPVILEAAPLRIDAENLTTEPGTAGRVKLRLTLNETGTVTAEGSLGLEPRRADLEVTAGALDLASFQPYLAGRTRALVTGGTLDAAGRLVAASPPGGPTASFTGRAGVAGFAMLDRDREEDLLQWRSLKIEGIDAGYNPLRIGVGEIALEDFRAHLAVDADGRLNIARILGSAAPATGGKAGDGEGEATPAPAPGKDAPLRIGVVSFKGGRVSFIDRSITPNYFGELGGLKGRVSGLASREDARADFEIAGSLDGHAPLQISGRVNPLGTTLFADLAVDFRGADLVSLSPYAGRHLGMALEKGKTTLALKVLVEDRKLESSSQVFIDQLTFGGKVESPGATSLPVRLGVALLKDRAGRITLDLPVTGSLDDPEFSVWRVVVKIVVNLLAKAATSPFALLGSLFGGGEELSAVEFAPGAALLDEAALKRLEALATALYERPGLRLEISGAVDATTDREGLRRSGLERRLKAEKLAGLVGQGSGSGKSLEDVVLEAGEHGDLLRAVYEKEIARRSPRAAAQTILHRIPGLRRLVRESQTPGEEPKAEQMEALLLSGIEVSAEDLRQLAAGRARSVRDHLAATGKVEPARLFLVEPKSMTAEKREGMRDSRADFRIGF